ncbi:2-succinylbenzoate--CoA ligase [Clostridium felsineum DSM 794]|nr:2-succinylbenzoate--CoA ligase [Clostridium felsineum DSM 794]
MMRENEVNSLKKLIDYSADLYGEKDFIRFKKDKYQVESRSFLDVKNASEAFSKMLSMKGIENVHFAIAGNTSFEWIAAYFGIVNSSNVIIPYDKKETPRELEKLLEHSDTEGMIFDSTQKKNLAYIREHNKNIKYFISLDAAEDEGDIISLKKVFEKYKGGFSKEIDNEKVCTILYTSGTTGKRKGVMLTQKSLSRDTMNFREKAFDDDPCVKLSVLPIHHTFCFSCDVLASLRFGYTICISSSVGSIFADCQIYHPTRMSIVPAIIKFIYETIMKKAAENPNVSVNEIAKSMLGGNIVGLAGGGAYADPKLLLNMAKIGIPAFVGYGMTECSTTVSTSSIRHNKIGSVGRLLNNTEMKVVDNEIVIRSESLMKGYYKNQKATEEVMKNGWLKTGDYGYIDEEGYVFITGRKKNLIILSNGENVSPEEVEAKLYEEDIIKEVVVYGKNNKIYAEIFPNNDFMERENIKNVQDEIARAVFRANQKLPVYKKVESFVIRNIEFEKTSSNKIKRNI